jgi:hypothetical protein
MLVKVSNLTKLINSLVILKPAIGHHPWKTFAMWKTGEEEGTGRSIFLMNLSRYDSKLAFFFSS